MDFDSILDAAKTSVSGDKKTASDREVAVVNLVIGALIGWLVAR